MTAGGRTAQALVIGVAAVAALAVVDAVVIAGAVAEAQKTFSMGALQPLMSLGRLLVAGGVLLVGALAWRASSVVVGAVYLLVGALLVALPAIYAQLSDAAPGSPLLGGNPLGDATWWLWNASFAPLGALGAMGAGLAISGVVSFVGAMRKPSA